ncbi:DUF1631 family protein [Aquabacterium sp.]|uniref:DUF1631 family protein n=1 Tax=Aquabacterium sp. TaxID=1872578 RepID=UPI002BCAE282|nr:DUF1631 family protein [Aquabacterium sp.]HSW07049.1 DUF1631 family protein [Aquabacterium sp.]
MSKRPTLHDFVEDEMLRAPLLFDQVVDAVHEQWRLAIGPQTRHGGDAARVLQMHRGDLVSEAVRALRAHVQAEISGAGAGPAASAAPAAPMKLELSLIDEEAVTSDIEISRAVERIKSMAEFELRELQSYTSALVGDLNVSRDHNPFRPETYVRALWEGVQAVPLSRGGHASFLHDAATPLARTLRQGYAGACTRLDDQGIEPAMHRTIVVTPTLRGAMDSPQATVSQSLEELRASLPMPLNPVDPPAATAAPSAPRIDQQLIELLSRLFDAIQSDRSLPADCVPLVLRLHPTTLRLAVQDTAMLDDYDHPVWQFMDRLAFLLTTAQVAEADRALSFARQLVDHLVADGAADITRFEWASGRISFFERHSLDRAVLLAQNEITQLQLARDEASEPIDIGTMDTVPAELMPEASPAPAAPGVPSELLALQPGNHVRTYLQGEWRLLQLLWVDRDGESWLMRDASASRHWALRLRAIERLFAAQLAVPLKPRSLVRSAASRVLRTMGGPAR